MKREEVLVTKEELNIQKEYARKLREYYEKSGKHPKALVETFGCQQNENDSERIKGMLDVMGFDFTEDENEADFILYNTCAVREGAEMRVLGNIGALKKIKEKRPELIVGICGCMMQQESMSKRIKSKFKHVTVVFGTHSLYSFPEIMYKAVCENERVISRIESEGRLCEDIPVKRKEGPSAWVSIMYGCNNFCSYCIVPYVRGRERSRDPENVIAEIERLSKEGVKEITLLGQNVNSYGKDLDRDIDFADLLLMADKVEGIKRIRFVTSHPKDMTDKLIATLPKVTKLCKQIHLPFQAGSNRILKEMNRGYTKERYLELAEKIRNVMPDASFTTDIIVGFPGETYEDFLETIDVIEKVRFDSVFSFIYSKRGGTPAAKMENQVPEDIKHKHFDILLDVQNRISREINETYADRIEEIMVEGISKNNPDAMCGRTDSGKIVNFPKDDTLNVGDFIKVKITKISTWSLTGERVEE